MCKNGTKQTTTPEERFKEANEIEKWLRENQPENKDYNTAIQETFNAHRNTTNNIQNQKRSMGEFQQEISKLPK